MRILFYVLAVGAATLGFLGLFRSIERALVGEGLDFAQFVIGVVGLLLAFVWIKRARAFQSRS